MAIQPGQSREPLFRLFEEVASLRERVDTGLTRLLGDGNGDAGLVGKLRSDIQRLDDSITRLQEQTKTRAAFKRGVKVTTVAIWTGIVMLWQLVLSGEKGLEVIRKLLTH